MYEMLNLNLDCVQAPADSTRIDKGRSRRQKSDLQTGRSLSTIRACDAPGLGRHD
jgi:hypothetical protein